MTQPPNDPRDFYELLALAGPPESDRWLVLPLEFLRRGQAELTDDDFLALCEGLRPTAPIGESQPSHQYPAKQVTLIRNAGLNTSSATRIVGRLKKAGLIQKDGAKLSFAPFWTKYPAGKNGAYLRVPAWFFFSFRSLGLTARDFRLLLLLGSYYYRKNTSPQLSSSEAGDILGIDRSQAARDLQGLVERARLTPGFPVGSRTPRGYGFAEFGRFVESRVHAVLGTAPRQALAAAPAASPSAADAGLPADFFGEPSVTGESGSAGRSPARKKGSGKQSPTVQPDSVHEALAQLIKTGLAHIDKEHQARALAVANMVLSHKPISPKQEEGLYRDAARLAGVDWAPNTPPAKLREKLVSELRLWKFDPVRIAMIAEFDFDHRPSKADIQALAMQCESADEVRAALEAKGLAPVVRQSS